MTTIIHLLGLMQDFRGWVALSILLGIATVTSGIGLLGTSAYLIATAALQPSISVLQVAIVGVRFFGISRGIFRYLERLISHSVNLRLLARLRNWFFVSIEPLVPAKIQAYRSGDVLTRANADIELLENFFVRVVSPVVVALVVVLGVSWWVSQAHPGFSMILVGGLLASGGVLPMVLIKTSQRDGEVSVNSRADLSAELVDSLQGAADLIAYQQEEAALRRIDYLAQISERAQTRLAWRGALANASNLLVSNLTAWLVVLLGGVLVSQNQLDGVILAVLVLVTLSSFEAVQPLSQAAQQLDSSLQAGKRLFQMVDQEPAVSEPNQPAEPPENGALAIRDVSFRFSPGLPLVLGNIDLEIQPGQHVALIGASGTGKTTLFNLIMRFWKPERGQILLGGKDLANLSGETIRRSVCLMTQGTYLFNTSLRQNLLLAKPEAEDAELWEILAQAHLADWVLTLPGGLDTWVGEHGKQMSGGERQRLAVARFLLQEPKLVLLDEPTSHLDTINVRQIEDTLFTVTHGKTVIWVTHHYEILPSFDRVLRLEDGGICELMPGTRN